jgi:TolB protein
MRGPLAAVAFGLLLASGPVGMARIEMPAAQPPLGVFTGSGDVGKPSTIGPGSAVYDPVTKTYVLKGGGENMWAAADHFQYVWKKVSGDVTLDATLAFTGTHPAAGTPNPHRKACLVIRQTLDSDAVYADAAVHGDGLTSLQWRDAKGAATHEVQSNAVAPSRPSVCARAIVVWRTS